MSDVSTPVAPEVTTPAAETPAPSTDMGDTIRDAYRKMNAPLEEPKAAAPAEPAAEEPVVEETAVEEPETPGQPRDAAGRYAKKEGEVPVEEPVAEEPVVEEPEPAPTPVAPGEVDISKPPSSLTAAEKAEYAKAPDTLKRAFHRREADFHRGLEGSRQMAEVGKQMDQIIRPYEAMIRAAGLNAPTVVQDLLNTAYQLRTGSPEAKLKLVLDMANHYQVDLTNLQSRAEELAANAPPPPDPRLTELQTKLEGLTKTLEQQRTAAEQAEVETQRVEVAKFAANPSNKHYEAVKLDMAALLQSGRANDLQDAYNKAIWANPAVREMLLTEQREADRKRAAEKAAAAKKAASVNVAPRGTPPPAPVVGTDMGETIRAALKKMQGS